MDGSISLGRAERKALLEVYRTHPDPAMRLQLSGSIREFDESTWNSEDKKGDR